MQAKVSGRVVQVDDPKKNKAGVESHRVHLLQSGKYEPEIVSINCRNLLAAGGGVQQRSPVHIGIRQNAEGHLRHRAGQIR